MATRADNKEGSCKEILTGPHAGKWRVQFTLSDEMGRKKRLSRHFPTKTDGKAFLHGLRKGEKVEVARRSRELTLGGWFDWLAENDWSENLDEKTVAIRKGRFEKYARKEFGDVPLSRINPLAVRRYYRALAAKGVGQPTLIALKADLVRCFNQAIAPYGRVPAYQANPFRLVLKAAEPRDAVAITPQHAAQALACEDLEASERAMLALYLLGGVRLSEQMAFRAGQIRFGSGLIAVDRAVKLGKTGSQEIGLPKGGKARMVVMCPTLEAILREIASERAPDALLWPCQTKNEPITKKRTYDAWKEIVKKSKLPKEMSPHDCRLSHINWIEKLLPEVSPTTLKEHVGHAAQGVTEANYTRPLTPAQDILRNGLERLVKELR
jgi:integrase